MVYRGKPSLGCHSCRARRIKCDQKRPGCTQCANVGCPCPGYRNTLDLMFRDETSTVALKARAKGKTVSQNKQEHVRVVQPAQYARDRESSSSSDSSQDSTDDSIAAYGDAAAVDLSMHFAQSLRLRAEDYALPYFLGAFLDGSRFNYVPTLFRGSSDPNCPLNMSVKASALASLSREIGSPEFASIAGKQYARALRATNAALQSRTEAKTNETLAAVLTLGLFETITQLDSERRAISWEAHINGASALLALRGTDQFHTSIGCGLFQHASDSIRIRAIQNETRLPPSLIELDCQAKPYLQGHFTGFVPIITEFTELRATVRERSYIDRPSIIRWLQDFDVKILNFLSNLPPDYDFKVYQTAHATPGILRGEYHVYGDLRSMRLWNTMRMTQMWTQAAMFRFCREELDANSQSPKLTLVDLPTLKKTAASRIFCAGLDICATVPHTMRYVQPPDMQRRPNFAPIFSLIWPLTVVAEVTILPEWVRKYAIDQLHCIGHELKIPQAIFTANNIGNGKDEPSIYVSFFIEAQHWPALGTLCMPPNKSKSKKLRQDGSLVMEHRIWNLHLHVLDVFSNLGAAADYLRDEQS